MGIKSSDNNENTEKFYLINLFFLNEKYVQCSLNYMKYRDFWSYYDFFHAQRYAKKLYCFPLLQ